MQTRQHRTPLSIWVAVVLFSLIALPSFIQMARVAPLSGRPEVWASILFGLAVLIYKMVALARLSRWPVVLHVGTVAASLIARHLSHFEWRDRFPMLGPFIVIIPLAVYLALILPHWRKMNWALFGRPYRPSEDHADVFA
jgi:hypothetical protein